MSYRRWTDSEKEFLMENKDLSTKLIAEKLNRTEHSVSKQKARMGLTKPKEIWTEKEKGKVERLWYSVNNKNHKVIGRSHLALKKMAYKQNLGTRYNAGGYYLTTTDVGKMIGLHSATVRKYVLQGRIKATFFGSKRIARISPEDMIEFIDKNKKYLDEVGANINKDLISPYINAKYN